MKKSLLLLYSLVIALAVVAQTPKEADNLFKQKDYAQALVSYEKLVGKEPKNELYLYRLARCEYELGNDSLAIAHFIGAGRRYPLRDFYLGQLYTRNYQYTKAIQCYSDYLTATDTTTENGQFAAREMARLRSAARFIGRVEVVEVLDSSHIEKENLLKAYSLSADCGTLLHDSLGVSFVNQRQTECFWAERTDSGMQLCKTTRLLDTWGDTVILLNSKGQIGYPYMMGDGKTLYVSIADSNSIGGWDIYRTTYNRQDETLSHIENMGMPYNSKGNDYLFTADETDRIARFATDRDMPDGMACIYSIRLSSQPTILRNATREEIEKALSLSLVDTTQVKKAEETTLLNGNNETKLLDSLSKKENIDSIALQDMERQEESTQSLIEELHTYRREWRSAEGMRKEELRWRIVLIEKELLWRYKHEAKANR